MKQMKLTRQNILIGLMVIVLAFVAYSVVESDVDGDAAIGKKADAKNDSRVTNPSSTPLKESVAYDKPANEKAPAIGVIDKAINELASQIVAGSPNQREAFSYLAEAGSYRIQELRTRRMQAKAEEEKAAFNAKLWSQKSEHVSTILDAELKQQGVDGTPKELAALPLTQSRNGAAYVGGNVAVPKPPEQLEKKETPDIRQIAVNAIYKDAKGYVARLVYKGKSVPVHAGESTFGGVKINKIDLNKVVVSLDDDETTLFAD